MQPEAHRRLELFLHLGSLLWIMRLSNNFVLIGQASCCQEVFENGDVSAHACALVETCRLLGLGLGTRWFIAATEPGGLQLPSHFPKGGAQAGFDPVTLWPMVNRLTG